MPNGVTSSIYDGSDMSLRGFALKCVKQLAAGYCATNGGNDEMPRYKAPKLKVGDYHAKQIAQAEEELKYWLNVKDNQELCKQLYEEETAKRVKDNVDYTDKNKELKERYTEMLKKVEAWNVDSKYKSLKELMIKHLKESIEWDCVDTLPYSPLFPAMDEWINNNIESLRHNISYHFKELRKEQQLVAEDNAYLEGLYKAIDEFEKKEGLYRFIEPTVLNDKDILELASEKKRKDMKHEHCGNCRYFMSDECLNPKMLKVAKEEGWEYLQVDANDDACVEFIKGRRKNPRTQFELKAIKQGDSLREEYQWCVDNLSLKEDTEVIYQVDEIYIITSSQTIIDKVNKHFGSKFSFDNTYESRTYYII